MKPKRCLSCMRTVQDYPCPHCGYDPDLQENPADALPCQYILHKWYRIGAVLDCGSTSITYAAWDQTLQLSVTIQEYFPIDRVQRTAPDPAVLWASGDKAEQDEALEAFTREARMGAARTADDKILDVFLENGTAYIVRERTPEAAPAAAASAWPEHEKRPSLLGLILGAAVVLAAILAGVYFCIHFWEPATCEEPAYCSLCGKQQGEPWGHTWQDASCCSPQVCIVCGKQQGEALGHSWAGTVCESPERCTRCGAAREEPLGHSWEPASCEIPETCARCGKQQGEPLGHSWEPASCETPETCARCGKQQGEPLGHSWLAATYEAPETCAHCGETRGEPLSAADSAQDFQPGIGLVLNSAKVRLLTSPNAPVVATLSAGDQVNVLTRQRAEGIDWYYVKLSANSFGWIVTGYVRMDSTLPAASPTEPAVTVEETPGPFDGLRATVRNNWLNIRSQPNTKGIVVGCYNYGQEILLLEVCGGWGRTDLGWVSLDYVTMESEGEEVVARGVVTAEEAALYAAASQESEALGFLFYGSRIELLEKNDSWGRTKYGWLRLSQVYVDGTTGTSPTEGTVTADRLNVRSGPGPSYRVVASIGYGEQVKILEQFSYNGTTWGCTAQGWVSMEYIKTD